MPKSQLDPLALNVLKQFVPVAQQPNGAYIYQNPIDNNPTQVLVRGDQYIGANQFTFRSFVTRANNPFANGNLPYFDDVNTFKRTTCTPLRTRVF